MKDEMHAGKLTRLLAFDGPNTGSDDFGGILDGHTGAESEVRVWAYVQYLKGGEEVMQARLRGVQPVVIVVRNCAEMRAINTEYRARDVQDGAWVGDDWSGTIFNVRARPVPTQDRKWLEILAESGVST
jgi:head-tail adaptor